MKILISAGPTQEPIDSVRFITNASSGKMGIALADAAIKEGMKVTLVLGPTAEKPRLKGVKIIKVRTADEMAKTVLKKLESGFDAFISAAAVGDYTPKTAIKGKISSEKSITIKLAPTKKITALAKRKFPKVFIVAFKAEHNVPKKTLINRAMSKLSRENLDLIVANDIGRNKMGSSETDCHIIDAKGKIVYVKKARKSKIAEKVISFISRALERESA